MDINKALESNRITAYRLAKDLGIAYSTIDRWKRGGKISPAHEKLLSIYFVKSS